MQVKHENLSHSAVRNGFRNYFQDNKSTTSSLPEEASSSGDDRRLCATNSLWMDAVAASPRYPGTAGLFDHSPISAQEEEAERLPDQPEDPERESESGQWNRHWGPEKYQCVLLSVLALQNFSCLWQVTLKAQRADWRQRGATHTEKEDPIIQHWWQFSFNMFVVFFVKSLCAFS